MGKKEKPIILAMEDARNDIITSINKICNDNCLSYYFLELIIKDIYREIIDKSNSEIITLRNEMQKQKECAKDVE